VSNLIGSVELARIAPVNHYCGSSLHNRLQLFRAFTFKSPQPTINRFQTCAAASKDPSCLSTNAVLFAGVFHGATSNASVMHT
jgi:hypothetical protein